jgi:hypothetical protein
MTLEYEKIQPGMLHETVKSTMRRVLQDFGNHVETYETVIAPSCPL